MAKTKHSPLPRHGASSAVELYQLVGIALSWWEASEDVIMGLFRVLCDPGEPVATQTFIESHRSVRYRMLRNAMKRYEDRFEPGQVQEVEAALRALERLATTRNEIAHGHVSEYNGRVDGETVASGNYLVPSYNEKQPIERGFRYSHVPETIINFTDDVRRSRGVILDIKFQIMKSECDRHNIRRMISHISDRVTKSKLPHPEIEIILNDLIQKMAAP